MTGTFFLKHCTAAVAVLIGVMFCAEANAQFANMMMSKARKDRTSRVTTPTRVNADAMDIDIAHDKITLLGNVEVDDPEMNIKCQKMVIVLENKKDEKDASKDAAKTETADAAPGGNKQVNRIECTGDVVITRNDPDKKISGGDIQKAYAGKAVYSLVNDTITMTENPVIVSGPNRLAGEKIELNIKTERMLVFGARTQTAGGLLGNAADKK